MASSIKNAIKWIDPISSKVDIAGKLLVPDPAKAVPSEYAASGPGPAPTDPYNPYTTAGLRKAPGTYLAQEPGGALSNPSAPSVPGHPGESFAPNYFQQAADDMSRTAPSGPPMAMPGAGAGVPPQAQAPMGQAPVPQVSPFRGGTPMPGAGMPPQGMAPPQGAPPQQGPPPGLPVTGQPGLGQISPQMAAQIAALRGGPQMKVMARKYGNQ